MINFRRGICTVVSNVFPGIVVVTLQEPMAESPGATPRQICACFVSVIADAIKRAYLLVFQRGVKSKILEEDLIIRNLPYKFLL